MYEIVGDTCSTKRQAIDYVKALVSARRRIERMYGRDVRVNNFVVLETLSEEPSFQAVLNYDVLVKGQVVIRELVDRSTIFGHPQDTRRAALASLEDKLEGSHERCRIVGVQEDTLAGKFIAYAVRSRHAPAQERDGGAHGDPPAMTEAEITEFWDDVHYTAAEVAEWPAWKRGE